MLWIKSTFLNQRAFYELNKTVLPVGSSWSGKAGQHVVTSLHGGVHFVTQESRSGMSRTFQNLSLSYIPVTEASQQAKISEKRCIDIYQYLRSTKLLATPIMLGGKGLLFKLMSLCLYTPKRLTSSITIFASILALFSLRMAVVVVQLSNSGSLVWYTHPHVLQ